MNSAFSDSFKKYKYSGNASSARVNSIKNTEMTIKTTFPVFISSFSSPFIVFFKSEILKTIARLTKEKHNNVVVKILSTIRVFSISIKNEEKTVKDCPSRKIGTNSKKNFVQINFPGFKGEVFVIHKETPSETIAG